MESLSSTTQNVNNLIDISNNICEISSNNSIVIYNDVNILNDECHLSLIDNEKKEIECIQDDLISLMVQINEFIESQTNLANTQDIKQLNYALEGIENKCEEEQM